MKMETINLSNPDDVRAVIARQRQATIQKFRTRIAITVEQVRRAGCRNAKREEKEALERITELVNEAVEEGSRAGLVWFALSRVSLEKNDDPAAFFSELAELARSEVLALLRAVVSDISGGVTS